MSNKNSAVDINKTAATKAVATRRALRVNEIFSFVGENMILVELDRPDKIFQLGILSIKENTNVDKLKLLRWEPNFEPYPNVINIAKQDEVKNPASPDKNKNSASPDQDKNPISSDQDKNLAFPAKEPSSVLVYDSNSNFLFISDIQDKELYVYYRNRHVSEFSRMKENEFAFKILTVFKNIQDEKQKLNSTYIDPNDETKAYAVFSNKLTKIITVYKFTATSGDCLTEIFNVNYASVTLNGFFLSIFTLKSNCLVVWDSRISVIGYFELEKNKCVLKNLEDVKIADIRPVPNTDDILILNSESIDYIEAKSDSNDINGLELHRNIIKFVGVGKVNIVRTNNKFLFLFISDEITSECSCQIYDFSKIKQKKPIDKPDFQVQFDDMEDEVYMTKDSKHFIFQNFRCEDGMLLKYEIHLYKITDDNQLKKVEIDKSQVKNAINNENFVNFSEYNNCIFMLRERLLYTLNI